MSRVLVAMSGGVDSSVAAALLVEEGHEVIGVTMKTFCYSGTPAHPRTCCGLEGITDAKRVAASLGIPHYVFDVEDRFNAEVIDDFVSEYARGHTPNPCVNCNSTTKFDDLLQRGRALGCDRIASGHYVRLGERAGGPVLRRGRDERKDQSYFLWALPRTLLPRLSFPLGHLTKAEVRERARALGLVTADKPESQEICFVPTGDYRDLLRARLGEGNPALQPGPIVRRDGTVMGEHRGYAGFTVGQRRGLGGGFPEPLYVLEIRPERREVVVGTRDELFENTVEVSGLNWLVDPPPPGTEMRVQLRYRAPAVAGTLRHVDDDTVQVELTTPQPAVTPGQSAVFFDADDVVLGGGRIQRAFTPADVG